jgi:hypothetical protein
MRIDTKNILPLQVSFFQHKGAKQSVSISLIDALQSFGNGTYDCPIKQMQEFLSQGNHEEYSILKAKLPAITFCGEFNGGHAKGNMVRYSNLLIIDIDKLSEEEYNRVKKCLSEDEYVFAYWTSPSGNGIKGLMYLTYPIEIFLDDISDYHTHAFRQVKEYFTNTHAIDLDKSGSDTSRLCFVTSDKDIVVKDWGKPFEVDLSNYSTLVTADTHRVSKPRKRQTVSPDLALPKSFLNPTGKNNLKHRQEIQSILKFLKKKKKSITYCYDNWYRTAFAIANSFSCDLGEKYFLELCRLDGAMHDETASRKILIYSYENSRGLINFSTIIHFAMEQGYVKTKRGSIEGG